MAHAGSYHKMMQNLRGINNDMDKFSASHCRFNAQIASYFENNHESEQPEHFLMTYLKDERIKLLSELNSKAYHSNMGTPKNSRKSKLKFSSKKKSRPTMKRTPLKVSTSSVSNAQNTGLAPPQSAAVVEAVSNGTLKSKIPQKKTLLSLSSKPQKMNICNEKSDSENDENMAPLNLLGTTSKSLVQQKLEQQHRKKQAKKKPKVDALQRAKEKRLQDEQKERERAKQRELKRAQIAENKRKAQQKLAEKQQKMRQQQQKMRDIKTKKHNTNKKMLHSKKSNQLRHTKKMPNVKKIAFKVAPNAHNKNKSSNMKPNLQKNKVNVKAVQQPRAQSPTDYEISDYDSNYSDSDLDEDACGKYIPEWARRKNPVQMFERQKAIDPDTIFGRMHYKTVDLEVLFKDYPSRTKYRNRSASGDWSKDQISWTEEQSYKKSMGWCK